MYQLLENLVRRKFDVLWRVAKLGAVTVLAKGWLGQMSRQRKIAFVVGSEEVQGRRHKGDIMSPEKRSALMSRIKGHDTGPEKIVAAALEQAGLRSETQARDLPGRPDFVFRDLRVAVFVDGDFWHGWRFPQWADKLSEAWEAKITSNRARDARNHRKLRRMEWTVVRIWEHQIHRDLPAAIARVKRALADQSVSGR